MKTKSTSIPAPVGGWNARDSIADMKETDATIMENWFPNTTDIQVRRGDTRHATGIGAQVETLAVYNGASSSSMFGIAGGSIYNVTSAGAVGAAVVSGLSNSRWQYTNVATTGGRFLMLCNGTDLMRYYDGTTWSTEGTTYTITGVTSSNIKDIFVHKNRVWLVEKNSLKAWYLPTSSIAGAANSLDLSSIVRNGGYLVSGATWTIDAGYGIDDHVAFITSQGEVVVYRGTDPSSASTWAMVGVFQVGAPIGQRCLSKYSGDLLVLCRDGLMPLSSAIQSSRTNPTSGLTDKIRQAVTTAAASYSSTFGWDVTHYPDANMLLLNVPVSVGTQEQYVMNTISRAWGRFTGWAANCFAVMGANLYFGGNGVVFRAWYGSSDYNAAGTEIDIAYDCRQAFSYAGNRAATKRWLLMRPLIMADGSVAPLAGVNTDFDDSEPVNTLVATALAGALWDSAIWDSAVWGGNQSIVQNWQGISGVGRAVAPRLVGQHHGASMTWIATDIVYESGGVL